MATCRGVGGCCCASADGGCSCDAPIPRCAGVTAARIQLCGVNTPWNWVRCIRDGGTSAASRALRSSGSRTICVVPSARSAVAGTLPPGGRTSGKRRTPAPRTLAAADPFGRAVLGMPDSAARPTDTAACLRSMADIARWIDERRRTRSPRTGGDGHDWRPLWPAGTDHAMPPGDVPSQRIQCPVRSIRRFFCVKWRDFVCNHTGKPAVRSQLQHHDLQA